LGARAWAEPLPVNPPRDDQEAFRITTQLLGSVVSNLWGSCLHLEDGVETLDTAKWRTAQARYDLGYRWIRHANAKQGLAQLVQEPTSIADMAPDLRRTLWNSCPDTSDSTQYLQWWGALYSRGKVAVPDSPADTLSLYLHQIWHLDLFGPGGAGWNWEQGDNLDDLDNGWSGDYFDLTGLFAAEVDTGKCIDRRAVEGQPILDAWRNHAALTAQAYRATAADSSGNQISGTFKRWMILNEPFMRGLFPWNAVTLFRAAKERIRQWNAPGIVYIGGTSGGKGLAVLDTLTGESVELAGNPHRWVTLSPLERQFALFAYGAGDTTDQLQNESLGVHFFTGGPPESRLLGGDYHMFNTGFLESCNSIFSLGRFWGMDPVRVTVDEAALLPSEDPHAGPFPNPAETQANYVARTLLLGLATGYLDAIHLAFKDHCDAQNEPAARPGIAAHADVDTLNPEIIKPGYWAATLHNRVMRDAAYESSIELGFPDLYGLRFRGVEAPDTTIAAFWSSAPKFDNPQTVSPDTITVQVANDAPLQMYWRVPSKRGVGIPICDESIRMPIDPGGIRDSTITPRIDTSSTDTTYLVDLPVTGAPLYLKSADNHVRQAQDRFSVTTLSGLRLVGDASARNIYEITVGLEEGYGAGDTLEIELPATWIPPQDTSAAHLGYITVGRASASLQNPASDLEVETAGHRIRILPHTRLYPGAQFTLLYGDYRQESVLLDMGPWIDGPVDLDFLKLENWMTAEALYSYQRDPVTGEPIAPEPYRVPPRVGWAIAPDAHGILGDDERRVHRSWMVSPGSIYRDHNGIAFADSTGEQENPPPTAWPLRLRLDPNRQYDVCVYLNNPDVDYEECDPAAADTCSGKVSENGEYWIPDMTTQRVRVKSAVAATEWRDSTEDRLFRISTGADGLLTVEFRRCTPAAGNPASNFAYCYGLEAHPTGLGGGPGSSYGRIEYDLYYWVNGTLRASDTIVVDADRLIPMEPEY
jgi:hypothetical protein